MNEQRNPSIRRLLIAALLLSLWLLFLFVCVTFGGAIHLALVGVLALRPWRLPDTQPIASRTPEDLSA